jgi:hypothetical protein
MQGKSDSRVTQAIVHSRGASCWQAAPAVQLYPATRIMTNALRLPGRCAIHIFLRLPGLRRDSDVAF